MSLFRHSAKRVLIIIKLNKMKKLELNQMENVEGGSNPFGVKVGCAFVALALAFGLGTGPFGGFAAGIACAAITS